MDCCISSCLRVSSLTAHIMDFRLAWIVPTITYTNFWPYVYVYIYISCSISIVEPLWYIIYYDIISLIFTWLYTPWYDKYKLTYIFYNWMSLVQLPYFCTLYSNFVELNPWHSLQPCFTFSLFQHYSLWFHSCLL